jgi:hypothetical protein
MPRLVRFAILVFAAALGCRSASAQPPDPALLARLATHAAAIERMRTQASYLVEGEVDELDGSGKVDHVETMTARVETDGRRPHLVVVKSTDDGKDSTEASRRDTILGGLGMIGQTANDDVEVPFAAEAQPHYVFDQIGTDPADPARVHISFIPREPSEHTSEGSAWVETKTATLLSAGFKLSKPGFFVEYVHVTLEFGEKSAIGPALSRVQVDGRGGFLFFRRHFRVQATMSDYRIVP